jgi:flagellar assembly factor FliW
MPQAKRAAAQPKTYLGKVVTFPQGIPGFETYTEYTVFHKHENKTNVYWLESVDAPKVTFTLVDPTDYGLNYSIDLTDEETSMLGTDDPKQLAVLLMLSKEEDGAKHVSTLHANIAGPLIINVDKRLGLQKVLVTARLDVNITQS